MSETTTPDIPASEAAARFEELLRRAAEGKERVVLTEGGRPLVALVPIEDVATLEAAEDAADAALARQRHEDWEREGRPGITLEEMARRHGIGLETPGA